MEIKRGSGEGVHKKRMFWVGLRLRRVYNLCWPGIGEGSLRLALALVSPLCPSVCPQQKAGSAHV